jgi:hypothetical protein
MMRTSCSPSPRHVVNGVVPPDDVARVALHLF